MPAPDVGLLIRTFEGFAGQPALTWEEIRHLIERSEELEFSSVSFPDHNLWRAHDLTVGFREAYSMVAAAATITSHIEVAVSVTNALFRNPGLLAKMADTLDEISGGRFVLGIGAGGANYPSDYETFGIASDHRFSRFAEAIQIIHGLLRDGVVDFEGTYCAAPAAELRPRGPSARGPRIIIAAQGPKMLDLTARYGDEWNWFHVRSTPTVDHFAVLIANIEAACEAIDRDPSTLRRSIDIAAAPGGTADTVKAAGYRGGLTGPVEGIVDALGTFGDAGIDEVRVGLVPDGAEQLELMGEVVARLRG